MAYKHTSFVAMHSGFVDNYGRIPHLSTPYSKYGSINWNSSIK